MVTKGINVVLFLIVLGFVHPTFHRATCAGQNFSHSSNKRNKKMQKFDQLSATYVHQQVPTGEPITLQKKKKVYQTVFCSQLRRLHAFGEG